MAAIDYRQLSGPATIDTSTFDDGSAAAASRLANSFKQFSNTASGLGAEINATEGAQAGDLAGSTGDPKFKDGFTKYTAYSQAYNNAATRSYAIRAEGDAEETAARLEIQAANDPTHFAATFGAVKDATIANAPPVARGMVADIYNKRMNEGVTRLVTGQQKEYQSAARVDVSEGIARSSDRIANWQASDDPQLHAQADDEQVKLGLMIDGAKNDGTLTDTEAQSAHIMAQRSITEQTVTYRFKNEMNNPHGDPVAFIQRLQDANRGSPDVRPDLADIHAQPGAAFTDSAAWAKRADGSQKGNGWLGLLRRPDGGVSSEISIGVELNGKEQDIPLLVPGLSRAEVDKVLSLKTDENFNRNLPQSIKNKAIAFAQQRIGSGKSPFASVSESPGSGAGNTLDPQEEAKLVSTLFETLRQKNALDSFDKRKNGQEEAMRYETGDRTATAQFLAGTLTQHTLLDMVTSQNLKPETARTLMNELDKGDTSKDDPKTAFNARINLLDYDENDLATMPGLTWKTRGELIEQRRKDATGWKGTQAAKEGEGRIERALGILPGVDRKTLSDDELTQLNNAKTTWYNEVDQIPPGERGAAVITKAEDVVTRFIRKKNADAAVSWRNVKQRYIQRAREEHGDPGGYGSTLKQSYENQLKKYDDLAAAAEAEAARK